MVGRNARTSYEDSGWKVSSLKSRPITRERRVANLEDASKGAATAELAQSTARKTDARTLLNANMVRSRARMLVLLLECDAGAGERERDEDW